MADVSFILLELNSLSLSFRKCCLHLAENLINLFQISYKTKVIPSPCILEITSFYSNYFSKQPVKALCSEYTRPVFNSLKKKKVHRTMYTNYINPSLFNYI